MINFVAKRSLQHKCIPEGDCRGSGADNGMKAHGHSPPVVAVLHGRLKRALFLFRPRTADQWRIYVATSTLANGRLASAPSMGAVGCEPKLVSFPAAPRHS